MSKSNFFQELQRVIAQNPSLPVVPAVHTDVVGGDSPGYWPGKFRKILVTEYVELNGRAYFLDEDGIEETVAAAYGAKYADALPESKLVRVYAGLPWQKAIIVCID
ncbi:MAG: hypothetical protein K2O18_03130 [Oscillospiraceae bacterium]|nr:hypothetical protein [Oscillospiraceae bacterium]